MHELYVFPWTRGAAAEREASVVGELATAPQKHSRRDCKRLGNAGLAVLISFRLSAS
jgi:hypothetical protein